MLKSDSILNYVIQHGVNTIMHPQSPHGRAGGKLTISTAASPATFKKMYAHLSDNDYRKLVHAIKAAAGRTYFAPLERYLPVPGISMTSAVASAAAMARNSHNVAGQSFSGTKTRMHNHLPTGTATADDDTISNFSTASNFAQAGSGLLNLAIRDADVQSHNHFGGDRSTSYNASITSLSSDMLAAASSGLLAHVEAASVSHPSTTVGGADGSGLPLGAHSSFESKDSTHTNITRLVG